LDVNSYFGRKLSHCSFVCYSVLSYYEERNVESTFGAMKRKFGDFCRCKKPTTQENEIVSRIVCYNACVLAEAMLSEDIEPIFMAN